VKSGLLACWYLDSTPFFGSALFFASVNDTLIAALTCLWLLYAFGISAMSSCWSVEYSRSNSLLFWRRYERWSSSRFGCAV